MKRYSYLLVLALPGLLWACEDQLPTGSSGGGLVPNTPNSVEIFIPFDEFAEDLSVIGGYGRTAQLGERIVATDFEGALNAHTLVRFGGFPQSVTVEDEAGTQQTDTDFTIVGAQLVIHVDSLLNPGVPATLAAGDLTTEWSPATATWEFAVDTILGRVPWPEPGAGPVVPLGTAVWEPSGPDSVVIELDSLTVAGWGDEENASRGARISVEEPGLRVGISDLNLRLEVRPSVESVEGNIYEPAGSETATLIYTPEPPAPGDGLRVGGAPSWRSVFSFDLPETLDGPPELCNLFGCPYALQAADVNYAGLTLASRAIAPEYATLDTMIVDMRPVLQPSLLPKSPLGESLLAPFYGRFPPDYFSGGTEEAEIAVTPHIRNLLRGQTAAGEPVRTTVTLLTPAEPLSLSFGEFEGPGSGSPPRLRLILTEAGEVTLP